MSTRQLRRLQQLVDASTGADAGEGDEENNDTPLYTSSMKLPKSAQQKKKDKHKKERGPSASASAKDVERGASEATGSPTTTTATSVTAKTSTKSKGKDGAVAASSPLQSEGPAASRAKDDSTLSASPPSSSVAAGARCSTPSPQQSPSLAPQPTPGGTAAGGKTAEAKQARAQQRRRKAAAVAAAKAAEEDALLEAALHAREVETSQKGGADAADASTFASSPTTAGAADGANDLLSSLCLCDPNRLDTRTERIRTFGPDAVEDVGDGSTPHRRLDGRPRDTGSNSLFPEHGHRFKFKPCALSTPNRYRWPPYDSLGVYLRVDATAAAREGEADSGAAAAAASAGSEAESHTRSGAGTASPPSAAAATAAATTGRKPLVYVLNCDSAAFRRAEESRELCTIRMGGMQELIDSLATHGVYHIPTLLQMSSSFQLTGDAVRSMEMVDVALYSVGQILSHVPLSSTWRRRAIPYAVPTNQLIFSTLQRGVHVALRRGCTRTAWELGKLVFSLDEADPCGMLLLLDYTALRAKRWVWLVSVMHMAREAVLRHDAAAAATVVSAEGNEEAGAEEDKMQYALAQRLLALPGFSFSAALAKHFLEAEQAAAESSGKPPKVLRDASPVELERLTQSPSARELLAQAMLRFPCAAMCLVEEALAGAVTICSPTSLSTPAPVDPAWEEVMAEAGAQRARAEQLPDGEDAIADHLARLFVARHVEMWKSAEVTKLLRATLSASAGYGEFRTVGALTQTQQNALSSAPSPSSSSPASASAWVALTQPPSYELLTSCLELREEDVLGSAGAVIPANLLDPEDTEEEARRAQAQIEAQLGGAMQNRALNPLEEDALLRFRALYGPLAPGQQGGGDASPAEQLRAYRFRFTSEGHVGANLGQEGILMLFVRTLLPWNSTEEMALRRLLEERGIADPVATRTAEERARDAELRREMEDADAAEWESLDSYTDEEEEAGGADGVAGGDVD